MKKNAQRFEWADLNQFAARHWCSERIPNGACNWSLRRVTALDAPLPRRLHLDAIRREDVLRTSCQLRRRALLDLNHKMCEALANPRRW